MSETKETDATVEMQNDPQNVGRVAFRITGRTKEAVQKQITLAVNAAERQHGHANFLGPERLPDPGWYALGEVFI